MLDHVDLKNVLQISQSVNPQVVTASVDGGGVDLRDCESEVLVLVSVGDVTALVASVKLQQSLNDNTSSNEAAAEAYADIDGASVTPTFADNTPVSFKVDTRGKRFVRAVVTFTSGTGVVGVTVISAKRILG